MIKMIFLQKSPQETLLFGRPVTINDKRKFSRFLIYRPPKGQKFSLSRIDVD